MHACLEKDGILYPGLDSDKASITATFHVPFRSSLLGFDLLSEVTMQFIPGQRRFVRVTCAHADFYQVYEFLKSTFGTEFRLGKFSFDNDLLKAWTRWPWNTDVLIWQFKHNPEKTLSFVRANLPELITILSIRRIPREFNEPTKFIVIDDGDQGDFFS